MNKRPERQEHEKADNTQERIRGLWGPREGKN